MKSIVRMLAVATAVVSLGVQADDDDELVSDSESAETTEASSGDTEEGEGAGAKADKNQEKAFSLLPCCERLDGSAEVLIPGKTEWQAVEEAKYYPLGSSYRTADKDSYLVIKFGPSATVEIQGTASFTTRAQPLGEKSRSIGLSYGTVLVKMPSGLKDGLFSVTAPGFTAKNLAGDSRYTYNKTVDGDEAIIRCVTQTLAIEGRHFTAPALRAANEIRIRTSQDQLMTALYGTRGDILVRLDQGLVSVKDYSTGDTKVEPKTLDWKLSPRTAVRIHRAKLAIGERMAVATMTFDARGNLRNRCAFTEGMELVNSGEIGPMTKQERDALDKSASELSKSQDVTDEDAVTTDADATEKKDSAKSDDSSSDSDDLEF